MTNCTSRTVGQHCRTSHRRGSAAYWTHVAAYGVPSGDHVTCEGDIGYGPCGRYGDWTSGRCAHGHKIEIANGEQ